MKLKVQIQQRLQAFSGADLRTASIGLLNTLGYQSEKTLDLSGSPEAFLEQFDNNPDRAFRKDKALFDDWQEIHLLFQLTDQELSGQNSLFAENEVKQGVMSSYLFFALKLKGESYTRGKLAQITRQLNRLFPMPVMVLYAYDDKLSITIINRRRNKQDTDKDVLGKVTLIQEINLISPHPGHLAILSTLVVGELAGKQAINSFDALHQAWSEVLDIELLNKKFYRRIAEWFFFAVQQVCFPDGGIADEEQRNRIAVIRLLTRVIFCWFAKEKGVIPENLFTGETARQVLKDFDSDSWDSSSYYKAILQNLFFPTLSIPIEERKFRTEQRFQGKNSHYMQHDYLRYAALFKDETIPAELFERIPFLNGGLFECLDYREERGDFHCVVRVDGFSDRPKNPLHVPDALFFGRDLEANLSKEFDSNKKASVKVDGLIHILASYKFTVTENTPIEEEIALDPELLGRIFENLLAEYNPETEKTARKETGSFYTPRTIVDYMVNESLKAYLTRKLTQHFSTMSAEDAQVGLDPLFAYTEKDHPFTGQEQQVLVDAIYDIKILDPACGSGAFPIGMLQKLLYVLDKLDHRHDRWKERILGDTPAAMREETRKLLERSSAEYSWKLGLIQNCIYGVDIQPIAVQIAKLRCFIALLVDFEVRVDEDNYGVPALPNLAFKFVAADSLIKPPGEEEQGLFSDPFFERFANATEEFFFVRSPKEKKRLREKIEVMIEEKITQNEKSLAQQKGADLAEASHRKALASRNQIAIARQEYEKALWESYRNLFARRNDFVRFFDIRYFFPEVKEGFDVLIGNPPYVQIQKFPKEKKIEWVAQDFQSYAATADIYCLFYERGAKLLKPGGHLCYITSNKWMRAGYGKALREFLSSTVDTTAVLDFGMAQNFGAATTYTSITSFENRPSTNLTLSCYAVDDKTAMADPENYFWENAVQMPELSGSSWVVVTPERYRIKKAVEAQGVPLEKWALDINYGIKTGLNDAFYLTQKQRDELIAREPQAEEIVVPLLRGRYVGRYKTDWDRTWMLFIPWHFPVQEDLSIIGCSSKAEALFKAKHPKVYGHLDNHKSKLAKRNKAETGVRYEWYALQRWAASYWQAFRKPKIIYPNMTKYLPFYYDQQNHFFINDKAFVMTSDSESLPYLTAVLNSSLFRCCFRDNFPELLGSTYEVRKVFVDKIPIKRSDATTVTLFETLVNYIQFVKADANQLTSNGTPVAVIAAFLEEVIDACVMEVYFAEHMRERKLNLMDHVRPLLPANLGQHNETEQLYAVTAFFEQANATDHPVRNRLMRISSDSPELLAVIKKEGKV